MWDMQLVQYGKEVIRFREEFIGQLNEMICEIHRKLSGGKETLKIVYDPNSGAEELEAGLAKKPQSGCETENHPYWPTPG